MKEKRNFILLSELSFGKIDIKINKLRKIIILFFLIIGIIIFIIINNLTNIPIENLLKINKNKKISNLNENNKIKQQKIIDIYFQKQKIFCENQNLFFNENFEKRIKITNVNFQDKTYNMFVYKHSDVVSRKIIRKKSWENKETKNILAALGYYSKKKNIKNEDIYFVDVGANIGWYSILLGKYGFRVISFEPTKINNYILNKNYCLNKEINITIINKGLYNEEKKCYIYNHFNNMGNGHIICEKKNYLLNSFRYNKSNEITLIKLDNFFPFLFSKNLALIKIDIEGSEGKAIEGGIELITKYHIPFIFLEFTPYSLKRYDTEPKHFLQFFLDNGYKISYLNFLDKNYYSIKDILKRAKPQVNLYLIYSKILE